MKIRALIVEDEPLSVDRLRSCLAREDEVELSGEASDGPAAVEMIDRLTPDLVFLDVRLPGFSGFDVLRRTRRQPGVIFTTAHDEYAVHAFEWGAFDYLLKPYRQERLSLALQRFAERTRRAAAEPAFEDRLASARDHNGYLQRFFVRHAGTVLPVHAKEIVSITAEDDYSAVHTGGKTYLVYLPLREFARRLDPQAFARIHRASIVNLACIARLEALDRRLLVHMNDGSRAIASRAGAAELKRLQL